MSWKFNPPPGWPEQPEGWVPPPGWTPEPSWPPPPAGWQFWVPASTPTASPQPTSAPPPTSVPPPAAPPPAAPPPTVLASGGPFGGAPAPPFASGPAPTFGSGPAPAFGAAPPGQYAAGPAGPYGAAPGGMPAYGGVTSQRKPWFGQWWGILGLIATLLLGAAIGYGATRVALDSGDDDTALGPAVTASDPSLTIDDSYRGAPR